MNYRARFRVLLARLFLSLVPAFVLYEVCVENVPVRFGMLGKHLPVMSSLDGKLSVLAFCVALFVIIWTFDFGKLTDRVHDLDESDEIQTLFRDPKDGPG